MNHGSASLFDEEFLRFVFEDSLGIYLEFQDRET
jgi:hypothetical protein